MSIWTVLRRILKPPSAQMDIQFFMEKFPGRCPICSYHYYGVTHGYEIEALPPQHDCLERKARDTHSSGPPAR